ncbi:type IV secretion system protein TrbL [Oryzisolibacter propanilivorax]|uniref:Type IV secretion system protein TrbL n=1 Tax=Oryzisolibacter propanilivorax TaxID=1527607 RepID=A0A1G9UIP1_9BURK|nr:P-type conjugative transfer protein TrbL [Oryzisolibacter propanilivorax]SDM59767.1 type IV secretion system protein TrbL [Oryzisolibacter propanilivorax]
MNDVSVIDRFLDTFSRYIDSGFGLLQGEVAFLTATLIVIDMTIAGLFWAFGHATGQGEDVITRLIRKVLYVGTFAYIIGNFNWLAGIVFRSLAGLGLTASGSGMSQAQLMQPGRLAQVGIEAGRPIMEQIGDLAGFPEFFAHLDTIVVLFLAWLVLIVCFFVLAVQLFVTLIEFKLTTLAGFVLIPFALWGKTSFLAEKVLGNVVSSGIKVLVLAVIVGIGSTLFSEFTVPPGADPSIDHALVIMLASLAMLALGIFGPGIATGLVSGAPQLGAGAMAGAAVGAASVTVAAGAAAVGAGSAIAAGARMAPGAARIAGSGARLAASAAGNTRSAFEAGSAAAGGGIKGAAAGAGNVVRSGTQSAGRAAASRVSAVSQRMADSFREGWNGPAAENPAATEVAAPAGASAPPQAQPAWAKRLHRRQQIAHAATTTAHTLRGGDGGGAGQGPSLRDSDS